VICEAGNPSETLPKVVGVTRQTILSIEKEKFVPSTLLALKIARFFDKPVEDIFYLQDDDGALSEL
jgi:putative transcriptional regulator